MGELLLVTLGPLMMRASVSLHLFRPATTLQIVSVLFTAKSFLSSRVNIKNIQN